MVIEENGHLYDSTEVCVKCNSCTDPQCCDQRPCTVKSWLRSIDLEDEE